MDANYFDQLEKIKKYKEMAKYALISQGEFPSRETINNIVNNIDMRTSILDHTKINIGDKFDIDTWNEELYSIYNDIVILYKTILKNELDEFSKVNAYAKNCISELSEYADKCDKLSRLHTETTSLGDTIYHQDSGFDISIDNNIASIELPPIFAEPKSKIILCVNGTGFDQALSYAEIIEPDDDKHVKLYDFRKNGNTYYVNKEVESKIVYYNADKSVASQYKFIMPNIKANQDNKYECYSGKGKIQASPINDTLNRDIIEKSALAGIKIPEQTTVSFYIKNGTYINFDFMEPPKRKNFSERDIKINSNLFYVTFTTDNNYNVFNFETDGEIWAEKNKVTVNNDNLIIYNNSKANDFMVVKYLYDTEKLLNDIYVRIPINDYNTFHIDSISIKQMKEMV